VRGKYPPEFGSDVSLYDDITVGNTTWMVGNSIIGFPVRQWRRDFDPSK
jgi:hypothetical protein